MLNISMSKVVAKGNYASSDALTKAIIRFFILVVSFLGLFAHADHHAETSVKTDAVATVESFEKLFGVTKGKRRNHTKGFCFDGVLKPIKAGGDQSIQTLSHSALFSGESKVVGVYLIKVVTIMPLITHPLNMVWAYRLLHLKVKPI